MKPLESKRLELSKEQLLRQKIQIRKIMSMVIGFSSNVGLAKKGEH